MKNITFIHMVISVSVLYHKTECKEGNTKETQRDKTASIPQAMLFCVGIAWKKEIERQSK